MVALVEETEPERYRPMLEVNFSGLAEMIRAVLPGMRERRSGHIINIPSLTGFGASEGFGFYCASKFAVEGFSEALAKEVGHFGIKVTTVEPGGVRSDFAGGSLDNRPATIEGYGSAAIKTQRYSAERHGTQPNDPAKFGPAMCHLADTAEPPLRLALGADAIALIEGELVSVSAEIKTWREITLSTAFEV